jgi:3-oxoacyl-[acyl-carrier protein] reductase
VLAACPAPDILVNNAAGPPPGDFRAWTRDDWLKAIDANMLSAIFFIKATLDGMVERRFGRIVNITSHMVKEPAAILGLSNGARAGLTGFVGGLSREVARHNVTMNNVLPGQFDTDRLRSIHERSAKAAGTELEAFRERQRSLVPARRFGEPAEFGHVVACLCAAQAGFITGQNILLDGGQYRGLM